MKEYGYIDENGYLVSKYLEEFIERYTNENGELIKQTVTIEMQAEKLLKSGWKPVDQIDGSRLDSSNEFSSVRLVPFDNGDRISYDYVETFDKNIVNKRIKILREKLANEDYKIIKCYEAELLKKELPYNISQLYEQRQETRGQINELENMTLHASTTSVNK